MTTIVPFCISTGVEAMVIMIAHVPMVLAEVWIVQCKCMR
jgi:hypothetical protein